jgi:hypothetical protein
VRFTTPESEQLAELAKGELTSKQSLVRRLVCAVLQLPEALRAKLLSGQLGRDFGPDADQTLQRQRRSGAA